jgi:excisionase family DNA binding protein
VTPIERYVTTQEAADVFHVSTRTIQNLVAKREIAVCKVGRCVRIPESSLEDYIRRNMVDKSSRGRTQKFQYTKGDKLV